MELLVTPSDIPAPARLRTPRPRLPLSVGQPPPAAPRRRRQKRGVLAASVLITTGAMALSGCGGSGAASGDEGAKDASGPRIKVSARNGATDAGLTTGVRVSGGKLTGVRLVRVDDGAPIKGSIAADGSSWEPSARLERGTKYQLVATAKDDRGRTATENATFTTVSPKNSFTASYTPDGGKTVGVGMPVSFDFDRSITDKKDVQSHITVTSSSGQQVVGHWFGSQRLDFRPQEYWKAGSKVTMKIDLDGVKGGGGITGVQSKTVTFTVGRSQVSTVDMNTQTMTVVRDGRTIKSVPISGGSPKNPTYNGQMVISEKLVQTRMDGSTVGFGNPGKTYDIPDVPHAMRLSASGTFVHGNYWGNPSDFGRTGTSHGCIGLRDSKGGGGETLGKWFFDQSLVGDVVVVRNSPEQTVKPDNGLNGWNLSWSDWQAGSAL
ncbi:L,D-transpeptidase [Streptomyces sp. GS7]|uniref:L,D-transpeptidase n=1 Tax=Streptomyces sp. GS7 TaxID=2692234 RepID=UPI0013167FE8|nr:Ig-like domain-containing protein [Streptomyces sp. GS7]QHC23832.1 L,D-transpeptidase family protein [Streptomyces sp. GS7]